MKMLEQSSQFHAWEIAMKKNIRITKAVIWVLTAVCIALCLFGPKLVDFVVQREGHLFAGVLRWWTILVTGYGLAVCAFLCLHSLWVLLSRLEKGSVFVRENVESLRMIEREVEAAAAGSLFLGITCLVLMLLVAIIVLFAALIGRVVRGAFEEAVTMQDELDYTV